MISFLTDSKVTVYNTVMAIFGCALYTDGPIHFVGLLLIVESILVTLEWQVKRQT